MFKILFPEPFYTILLNLYIMKETFRFPLFIFIIYYMCYLFIQLTGLNYTIYFFTTFMGYPSYSLTIFFTGLIVCIYLCKYPEDAVNSLLIGSILLIYSIIEFRYGIIFMPIHMVLITILYSSGLIIGSTTHKIYFYTDKKYL